MLSERAPLRDGIICTSELATLLYYAPDGSIKNPEAPHAIYPVRSSILSSASQHCCIGTSRSQYFRSWSLRLQATRFALHRLFGTSNRERFRSEWVPFSVSLTVCGTRRTNIFLFWTGPSAIRSGRRGEQVCRSKQESSGFILVYVEPRENISVSELCSTCRGVNKTKLA